MTAAELGRRLIDLWATLDALGAAVHRRPVNHLRSVSLRPIVAHETERVRVLTSPEAAPVLWPEWGAEDGNRTQLWSDQPLDDIDRQALAQAGEQP